MKTLEDELIQINPGLRNVLLAISRGVQGVSVALRSASVQETGTSNQLGDKQLVADVEADAKVLEALRNCADVAVASSEEQPWELPLSRTGSYSVAYDPLDGSSIIGANWAVGSIFGVWPGDGFVGRTGREQVAAVYAVHGPRTVLMMARPEEYQDARGDHMTKELRFIVQEFVLTSSVGSQGPSQWCLVKDRVTIVPSKKVFAPANLRATQGNRAYADLVRQWMEEQYTLRYSGGLVSDVHHILAKGGGVFCNPESPSAPAKLRLLYECMPMAFIVEAAGGVTMGAISSGSALDLILNGFNDRSQICLGSRDEVNRCVDAMAKT